MSAPFLKIHEVSKTFYTPGEKPLAVLKNISLEIASGEFFVLVGPSGCGKSTLLRIISGLDTDFYGTVTFQKSFSRADVGFVFQNFALFPWLTVEENIGMGLLDRGLTKKAQQEIIDRELERLHLTQFRKSAPRDLSGGMRQRVGIARALAVSPKIIFLDEPFSELDSFTAEALRQELLGIWRETGCTIVMITHIIAEAIELADRVAVMSPRPGMIEGEIVIDLPRPRNRRSDQFYHLEDQIGGLIKP